MSGAGADFVSVVAEGEKYMEKLVYDKDLDKKVDEAEKIDGGEWE